MNNYGLCRSVRRCYSTDGVPLIILMDIERRGRVLNSLMIISAFILNLRIKISIDVGEWIRLKFIQEKGGMIFVTRAIQNQWKVALYDRYTQVVFMMSGWTWLIPRIRSCFSSRIIQHVRYILVDVMRYWTMVLDILFNIGNGVPTAWFCLTSNALYSSINLEGWLTKHSHRRHQ